MKKPIYCSLAFGSASVNSHGEFIPCCNIRPEHFEMFTLKYPNHPILKERPSERINALNLRQIRKQLIEGEWPKACMNCKIAEDDGVGSMRIIWNRNIPDVPMTEYIEPNNIKYLDLTFGTKCNSKCMTCNAGLSDFWESEWKVIYPNNDFKFHARVSINDTTAQQLIEDFPNVEYISFVGGEPTISEEHLLFLKLLIEQGKSQNINLSYVTNLTGLTDELLSYWKHFKRVHTAVSIDAYSKVNEYIRYPFKWSKTENNLKTFLELCQQHAQDHKYTIGLSCTLSLFNAIQAPDLLDYWYETLKNYQTYDGNTLLKHAGAFINRVSNPTHSLITHLSMSYRQQGVEKIDKLLNKIESEGLEVERGIVESIKLVKAWILEDYIMNVDQVKEGKHFIETSDKFRNRNIRDYIPELADELEKIWKTLKV